jgi:hypothetical protein
MIFPSLFGKSNMVWFVGWLLLCHILGRQKSNNNLLGGRIHLLLDWCKPKNREMCCGVFGPQLIVSGYHLPRFYCTFPPHFKKKKRCGASIGWSFWEGPKIWGEWAVTHFDWGDVCANYPKPILMHPLFIEGISKEL